MYFLRCIVMYFEIVLFSKLYEILNYLVGNQLSDNNNRYSNINYNKVFHSLLSCHVIILANNINKKFSLLFYICFQKQRRENEKIIGYNWWTMQFNTITQLYSIYYRDPIKMPNKTLIIRSCPTHTIWYNFKFQTFR